MIHAECRDLASNVTKGWSWDGKGGDPVRKARPDTIYPGADFNPEGTHIVTLP